MESQSASPTEASAAFAASRDARGGQRSALRRIDDGLASIPLHPLLLAAYPVLLLYADNLNEVPAGDVLTPLMVAVGSAGVVLAALSLAWRDARRAAVVTSVIVIAVLMFGSIRRAIAPLWDPGPVEALALPLGILVMVLLAIAMSGRIGSRMAPLTQALNVIAMLALVTVSVPVVEFQVSVSGGPSIGGEPTGLTTSSATAGDSQRDIYHLIFDRYGSNQALDLFDDIDNLPFTDWLEGQGFQVVHDSRANYQRTTLSLAATLGMTLLDDLVVKMGPEAPTFAPILERIRSNRAATYLQDRGLEYIHVGSWYPETARSDVADRQYAPSEGTNFAQILFHDTMLSVATNPFRRFNVVEGRVQAETAEFQFDLLEQLSGEAGPKYVLAHLLVPHPPYVFLEDGTFDEDRANHASQLAYTNRRIREFLESLLAVPEEKRPIILLQADEGPRPLPYELKRDGFDWNTATDGEIAMKFGVLNAMYLPGKEGLAPLPSMMSLVNTYREVFNRYFGEDLAYEPDRSYLSPQVAPYRMTDITERLERALESTAQGSPSERAGSS